MQPEAQKTEQVPAQAPKIAPDDSQWLNTFKMAEKRGLLNNLPSADVQAMRAKANEIYQRSQNEYVDFLKNNDTYESEDREIPSQDGFGTEVIKGIKGVPDLVKNISIDPMVAAENALRGYARSLNPAPMFKDGEMVTLESLEALAAFPIVRGTELFARAFLPENERPPLTPLIDMIDQQEYYNQQLSQKTPGVQEAAEIASIVAGGAAMAKAGFKGAKVGMKWAKEGGPKFVRNFIAKQKAKGAERIASGLKSDLNELSVAIRSNGSLTDTIINEPKQVKKFLDNADEYSNQAFADEFLEELDSMENQLGEKVRGFRDSAYDDNKTIIPVPDKIRGAIQEIRQRSTIDGVSVLPSKINKELERWEKIASLGKMTPQEAIILDNLMVDIVEFGDEAKDIGKTVVKEINPQLLNMRAANKNALRNSSPQAKIWVQADDQYSQFITRKQKMGALVDSEKGADRLVSTILNPAKSRDKQNLEEMLGYAASLDPKMRGPQEFISQVKQIKSARALKDIKVQPNRVAQQDVMNFIKKHEDIAQKRMQVGAGVIGTGVGALTGGGGGSVIGGAGGALLAREAFSKVAAGIGNKKALKLIQLDNILDRAQKAKNLSKEARDLASDARKMYKHYGEEGVITALDYVASTPFAIELVQYLQTNPSKNEAQRQPKINIPTRSEPKVDIGIGAIQRRRGNNADY
ncbi:MAG: hypothetical protein KDD13_00335 [Mangrovimonas sp.]|nr:hypothetical protein [Mangrovimonas sp.]